ncbi:MAG: hydroxymethylglutaryl-CoA lyase [Chitinophagales bacterium]
MITPIKLIECPRDAMQGWGTFIPTPRKTEYLSALLEVGFDSLDFGSFVSPGLIPQMADTKAVLSGLKRGASKTKLLAIVANTRGAREACAYPEISDIGFPFSVSETFQRRNANSSIEKSFGTVREIQELCVSHSKRLVIYISMAFGNPYQDPWSELLVQEWIGKLVGFAVGIISLADTVGLATAEQVHSLTAYTIRQFPSIETGVHLHSRREHSLDKVEAAFSAGCRRFDGALNGVGGCPMAGDELVGNMDSLMLIDCFRNKKMLPLLNEEALQKSTGLAAEIFQNH